MPANVVRTSEDERHWQRAKQQAAKQGRAKDYAYVMGIFKRMSKGLPPQEPVGGGGKPPGPGQPQAPGAPEAPQEGSSGHHRSQAMGHMKAAMAHAQAHQSAKDQEEARSHGDNVKAAREAGQAAAGKPKPKPESLDAKIQALMEEHGAEAIQAMAAKAFQKKPLEKARKEDPRQTGFDFGQASKPKAKDKPKASGPFVGPKGGKYADAKHTIPWRESPEHHQDWKAKHKNAKQVHAKMAAREDLPHDVRQAHKAAWKGHHAAWLAHGLDADGLDRHGGKPASEITQGARELSDHAMRATIPHVKRGPKTADRPAGKRAQAVKPKAVRDPISQPGSGQHLQFSMEEDMDLAKDHDAAQVQKLADRIAGGETVNEVLDSLGPDEETKRAVLAALRKRKAEKSLARARAREDVLQKASPATGPFRGPRGGLWADPDHKIPYKPGEGKTTQAKHKGSHKAHETFHMRQALEAHNAGDEKRKGLHLAAADAHKAAHKAKGKGLEARDARQRAHEATLRAGVDKAAHAKAEAEHTKKAVEHTKSVERLKAAQLKARDLGFSEQTYAGALSAYESSVHEHTVAARSHKRAQITGDPEHSGVAQTRSRNIELLNRPHEHERYAGAHSGVSPERAADLPKVPGPKASAKEIAAYHTDMASHHRAEHVHAMARGDYGKALGHHQAVEAHNEAWEDHDSGLAGASKTSRRAAMLTQDVHDGKVPNPGGGRFGGKDSEKKPKKPPKDPQRGAPWGGKPDKSPEAPKQTPAQKKAEQSIKDAFHPPQLAMLMNRNPDGLKDVIDRAFADVRHAYDSPKDVPKKYREDVELLMKVSDALDKDEKGFISKLEDMGAAWNKRTVGQEKAGTVFGSVRERMEKLVGMKVSGPAGYGEDPVKMAQRVALSPDTGPEKKAQAGVIGGTKHPDPETANLDELWEHHSKHLMHDDRAVAVAHDRALGSVQHARSLQQTARDLEAGHKGRKRIDQAVRRARKTSAAAIAKHKSMEKSLDQTFDDLIKAAGGEAPKSMRPQDGKEPGTDLVKQDDGPGSSEHHKDQAMQHLAAAQAHAKAHGSAKQLESADEHTENVKAAQAATMALAPPKPQQKGSTMIKKGAMLIDTSAEDTILAGLGESGLAVHGAMLDPHGRQRMGAMGRGDPDAQVRQAHFQKGGIAGGTVYQGEHDRQQSREGDSREEFTRARELAMVVEQDPAGFDGQGGLPEWWQDAGLVNMPVGPMVKAAEPPVQILDDQDPYTRAMIQTDPREGQMGALMAYHGQGKGRGTL